MVERVFAIRVETPPDAVNPSKKKAAPRDGSMRWRGLEPPRPQWPLGPQPSASTNSATSAGSDDSSQRPRAWRSGPSSARREGRCPCARRARARAGRTERRRARRESRLQACVSFALPPSKRPSQPERRTQTPGPFSAARRPCPPRAAASTSSRTPRARASAFAFSSAAPGALPATVGWNLQPHRRQRCAPAPLRRRRPEVTIAHSLTSSRREAPSVRSSSVIPSTSRSRRRWSFASVPTRRSATQTSRSRRRTFALSAS
jgi:hypothetical protein